MAMIRLDPGPPPLRVLEATLTFQAEQRGVSRLSLDALIRRTQGVADLVALAALPALEVNLRGRSLRRHVFAEGDPVERQVADLSEYISRRATLTRLNYNSPLEIVVQLVTSNPEAVVGATGLMALPRLVKAWAEARERLAKSSANVALSRLQREAVDNLRKQLHEATATREAQEAVDYELYPAIASAAAALARMEAAEVEETREINP